MAQAIPIGLAVAGSLLGAGGTILASNAQAKEYGIEASQLDAQAGNEQASAQRRAIEERRQARLASSRAQALAAASGGGADDPSVVNAMAGLEEEGSYRALTALYGGDTAAQQLHDEAAARRRGAKSVRTAGAIKAAGSLLSTAPTILSHGSSLFQKYN